MNVHTEDCWMWHKVGENLKKYRDIFFVFSPDISHLIRVSLGINEMFHQVDLKTILFYFSSSQGVTWWWWWYRWLHERLTISLECCVCIYFENSLHLIIKFQVGCLNSVASTLILVRLYYTHNSFGDILI